MRPPNHLWHMLDVSWVASMANPIILSLSDFVSCLVPLGFTAAYSVQEEQIAFDLHIRHDVALRVLTGLNSSAADCVPLIARKTIRVQLYDLARSQFIGKPTYLRLDDKWATGIRERASTADSMIGDPCVCTYPTVRRPDGRYGCCEWQTCWRRPRSRASAVITQPSDESLDDPAQQDHSERVAKRGRRRLAGRWQRLVKGRK
jgi:hypothetical protein